MVAAYIAHLDAEGLAPSSLDVAMAAIVIELHELLCPQTISRCVTFSRRFEHDAARDLERRRRCRRQSSTMIEALLASLLGVMPFVDNVTNMKICLFAFLPLAVRF